MVGNMNIEDLDLNQLNTYHYGCALYIQRQIAPWFNEAKPNRKRNRPKTPPWKTKITKRINQLRAEKIPDDNQITEHQKPN